MLEQLFAKEGFALVPEVLTLQECEFIASQVSPSEALSGGTRNLIQQEWCAILASKIRSHSRLSQLIPYEYVAVQCTYFEKSASRNWLVPLHQDLSIPVAKHVENSTLRGWSEKEGTYYVQAPSETLEQMIAVRLHLDACGTQDGPLRVVPGTHTMGRLSDEYSRHSKKSGAEIECYAEQGEALVLRPLILHASSKASGTSRRRVLHFVFGPPSLPFGLQWQQAV
jgi:ectoine hydroxylase-related dioxygenase (phytanoyl-CoA dioxygenase family)